MHVRARAFHRYLPGNESEVLAAGLLQESRLRARILVSLLGFGVSGPMGTGDGQILPSILVLTSSQACCMVAGDVACRERMP